MERVRKEDNAVNGRFSDGDPFLEKIDATRVAAYWLNGIQEEIVNTIHAGGLSLDGEKEFQLAAAIRSVAGYDMIVDSRIFKSRTPAEKKALNSAGYYRDTSAILHLKEGQSARIVSLDSSSVYDTIQLRENFTRVVFGPGVVLEAITQDESAFSISGDGVEIIGARTKGFKVPFEVDIPEPKLGVGICTIDRCLGIGASRMVKTDDSKRHVILQINSTIV